MQSTAGLLGASDSVVAAFGSLGIGGSLLGFSVCFTWMLFLVLAFGTGSGDLKFMAALGAILGWTRAMDAWLAAMIAAAVFSIEWLPFKVGPRNMLGAVLRWFGASGEAVAASVNAGDADLPMEMKTRLPLAPFFALGAIAAICIAEHLPKHSFFGWLAARLF